MKKLFTSESVTEGHPDKIADQISDAILDEALAQDPQSRVAVETFVIRGEVMVGGQMTTKAYIDIPTIVRQTVLDIGYTRAKYGFDGETCAVITAIDEQSPDIALGVDTALEFKEGEKTEDPLDKIGAGDQGIMFGYASNETEEYMPLSISLAHKLARKLTEVRKNKVLDFLRPDGKTQVTVEFDGDGKPIAVDAIVVSTQHDPTVSEIDLKNGIREEVINKIVPQNYMTKNTKIYINPTGRFVIGGPMADTGLTGRKIIVDTYGGVAPHGGGAFSGKDPTKVDRSASYMARYVAKNVVAAGLASKCLVQLAYAIGVARPVSIFVDTFGTGVVDDIELTKIINELFDFRPGAIIKNLDLLRPMYKKVAAYGHFGRDDLDLPWERLDKVAELKAAVK
ncbi:methionine adenosyltransferase [Mesoaciditoga lauensis]|uniref:methionine adenosyltransferase n=1 Tax=Mesoaciditoga lauensis TaxID=1495039 RepID=UPI00055B010E|nr:methionine adenosyltransferase [Mesoaciditoga lauensis]